MTVLSIAYVSAATSPWSDADIAALLTQSRADNEHHGITGALLYHRERFVQIVEGDDEVVRARFAVIATDPRHSNIVTMREKVILERQFPEWTMGFRPLSDKSLTELAGFENFFARTGRERLRHADNEAQQFLEWLGEYWLPTA